MVLAQIGCRAFDSLHHGYLWPAAADRQPAARQAAPAPVLQAAQHETA
jgi:hypothetical protein